MKQLVTVKQLGEILTVKRKTLYMWAATGRIPSVTINGLVRFDLDEVVKWIESNRKSRNEADQDAMVKRRRKGRLN